MKKLHILRIAILIALSLLATEKYAYSFNDHKQLSFSHLTPMDGLSQVLANDIYVDEFGMIWVGTRDGLNCYNGKDIQIFRYEKGNPNSLFSNNIIHITGDGCGHLFIACADGIAGYDMRSGCFSVLYNGIISALHYDGCLFAASGNKLLKLGENNTFNVCLELDESEKITSLYISGEEALIGTEASGLWEVDLADNRKSNIIADYDIFNIYSDSSSSKWISTSGDGLFCIEPDGNIIHYLHSPDDNSSLPSDHVRCCCEDELGAIWVGTFKGLERLDRSTGTFTHFDISDGMTHDSVLCMKKDAQGTIWAGTYFGGVNYINPEYEIYHKYVSALTPENGLSLSVVGRILEDKNGDLWIATEGGGVNYYNRKEGTFRWYLGPEGGKLSADHIKSLYFDDESQVLWIGTHLGGLNRLDVKTGRVDVFRSNADDERSLPSDIIRDILPYGDSLVLATQKGVCTFCKRDGRCRRLFKNSEEGNLIVMVDDIELDSHGRLWVAANKDGIFRYDFPNDDLVHFTTQNSAISNNTINNIYEDHIGRIWLSTDGSGIDVFSQETETFHNYDISKSGYLSGCVYQVTEDTRANEMLLITDNGFGLFNPFTGECQHFNNVNGFPLPSMNDNALCLTRDGEVFLGGHSGMISFKKTLLTSLPKKQYKIIPSRLIVNGSEVEGNNKYMTETLPYCKQLTFDHNVSLFTIEFSISNFIPSNRDEMIYKLEGFSNVWNSCRNQNQITYSNLSPGQYRLIIKPANDSEEICKPYELKIRVRPPWYATGLAFILYFLIGAAILFLCLRSYFSRVTLQQSLIYEQKRSEDIEKLNQDKLNFFTNISHEIRTPLTVMTSQIESLMKHQWHSPVEYNKVLSLYKNCFRLKELVSELLEFRKQEQGKLQIKASRHNLVKFAQEYYLLYEEYARSKGIELTLEKETDHLEVWYDNQQMQKVVGNLLSNALKYTENGGSVTIIVRQEGNDAILIIRDTGCGIPQSEINNVFDKFYRVEGTESSLKEGTGIGLALSKGIVECHHGTLKVKSEEGAGSDFIVRLPLGYSHFEENQISDIPEVAAENPEYDLPALANQPEAVSAKPRHTMLVVDDNESIRKLLIEIMSPYYRVISSSNGEEALNVIENDTPDIVISDVMMPKMSGIELCRKIKGDINTCHIPVILLTAQVAVEQNLEGFLTGADDYISKPFNSELLISRCNNLVNSRIILQEKFSKQPQASAMMLATNPIDKEIMDKAMRIIEENLENNEFNINTFANEMAMSRSALFAKIKAVTGQTPNELIVTVRLKRGAWMLRNRPELSLNEIAEETGFSTAKYFSKCFMDVYHIRPSHYRKGVEPSN